MPLSVKQIFRLTAQQAKGFTLLELMVSIAIMAIIAGIAVPSYTGMIENNLVRSANQAFYASLVLARSEAVKNNLPVAICKRKSQTECADSGDWGNGWLVYIDSDNDKSFDSGEMLLDSHAAVSKVTLKATDDDLDQLIYQADGTQTSVVTFNVCVGSDVNRGSQITIGLTGRPSTTKGATSCPSA